MLRAAHLQRLLQRYDSADPREAGFRQRMLELLRAGAPAFARDHFDPGHFTASAFVMSPDRSSILLILHGKLGMWLQPGGHVEPGDDNIVSTARRELKEEVGLEAPILTHHEIFDIDIHDIPAARDPAHEHFDVRFLFSATSDQLRPGSDAKAARWVQLSDVCDVQSDASVMRAVAKLSSWLAG